jgi:hypothetical protein
VYKFLKEIERRKLSSLRSAHYAECEYEFLKETQATRPTLGTQRWVRVQVLQEDCHFDPLVAFPLTPYWTTPQLDFEMNFGLDFGPLVALPLTPYWATLQLDFEMDFGLYFDPLVALPSTPYLTTPQLDFELHFDPLKAEVQHRQSTPCGWRR